MNLIHVILVIVVVGVVMYLINSFIPMAGAIKSLLNILVMIVLVIWLLQIFGIIPAIIPFGRLQLH